jgi:hypothetical protein
MFFRNVCCLPTNYNIILEDSTLHNHRCENLKTYEQNIYSSELFCSSYPLERCYITNLVAKINFSFPEMY